MVSLPGVRGDYYVGLVELSMDASRLTGSNFVRIFEIHVSFYESVGILNWSGKMVDRDTGMSQLVWCMF